MKSDYGTQRGNKNQILEILVPFGGARATRKGTSGTGKIIGELRKKDSLVPQKSRYFRRRKENPRGKI